MDAKIWACEKCQGKFSSDSIDKIVMALDEQKNAILSDPSKKKIRVIENFISKCTKILHPQNLLIVRLKYNLIGLYGREKGFHSQVSLLNLIDLLSIILLSEQDLSEPQWKRKKELCEEILDVLKVLEPSMTVRKARIMYELHLPILMLAQIGLNNGEDRLTLKKEFQKGLVTLKIALKVGLFNDIS